MRRRLHALLATVGALLACLLVAGPASAATPGSAGGGGMFAILGLPSVEDIIKKVANKIFGALAQSLLPDFVKDAPEALFRWLATVSNPLADHHSNVYALMNVMRASAAALLGVMLIAGVVRGMISENALHPITVLARTAGVACFLIVYPTVVEQAIALFNVLSTGLLNLSYVSEGIGALSSTLGIAAIIAMGPFGAVLVLLVIVLMTGLLLVKTMLMYLVPLFVISGALVAVLWVLPETEHIPKTVASLFLAACAIPAGWALIFAVGGALAADTVTHAGGVGDEVLKPLSVIGIFALGLWWPFAVLGFAKSIPGRFSVPTGKGPAARAGAVAMKLKLAQMVASGSLATAAAGAGGHRGGGARLAADAGQAGGGRTSARRRGGDTTDPQPQTSAAATGRREKAPGDARQPRGQRAQEPASGAGANPLAGASPVSGAGNDHAPSPARDAATAAHATDPRSPAPAAAAHPDDPLRPGTSGGGPGSLERPLEATAPPAGTTPAVAAQQPSAPSPRRPDRDDVPAAPQSASAPGAAATSAAPGPAQTALGQDRDHTRASKQPSATTDAVGRPAFQPPYPPDGDRAAARDAVQTPTPAEQPSASDLQAPTQPPTTDHDA